MTLTKIAVAVIAFTLLLRLIWGAFVNSMTPRQQLKFIYFGEGPKWLDILSYILVVLMFLSVLSAIYLIVFWVFVA